MPTFGLTGYLAAAIAALALALGGAGVLLKRSYTANGALRADVTALRDANEALQDARKLADRVVVARARANAATGRKTARNRTSLDAAIARNPGWASQPLPKEVLDALE